MKTYAMFADVCSEVHTPKSPETPARIGTKSTSVCMFAPKGIFCAQLDHNEKKSNCCKHANICRFDGESPESARFLAYADDCKHLHTLHTLTRQREWR